MGAGVGGNETGHWESDRLVEYHDQFLNELGSAWHDWRPLDLTRMPLGRRDQVRADIRHIVEAEYGEAPLFVVKDPRICRFAGFLVETLEAASIRVVPVVILRNPLEVSASLQKRTIVWPSGNTEADAALLWLSHVLESERATRERDRAIITYDELVTDWRTAVSVIAAQAGLDFPVPPDEAARLVDEFLTGDLRHHARKAVDVALDPVLRGWVSEAFEAMVKLAANPAAVQPAAVLDRVYGEFRKSVPIITNLLAAASSARAAAVLAAEEARSNLSAAESDLAERTERLAAIEQDLMVHGRRNRASPPRSKKRAARSLPRSPAWRSARTNCSVREPNWGHERETIAVSINWWVRYRKRSTKRCRSDPNCNVWPRNEPRKSSGIAF